MAKKGKQKSPAIPTPSALEALLTDEDHDATFAAVLTEQEFAEALADTEPARVPVIAAGPFTLDETQKAVEAEARQSELRFEPSAGEVAPDDAPPKPGIVNVAALWWSRLTTLAADQSQTPTQYVESLIRRQWVARPLGKVKP